MLYLFCLEINITAVQLKLSQLQKQAVIREEEKIIIVHPIFSNLWKT